MTPRDIAFAAGSGVVSAMLAMSMISGSPLAVILAYLSPLPLLVVGLSQGARACAIGCLAGTFGTGLALGAAAGSIYALSTALPVWLVSMLAMMRTTDQNGQTVWFPSGVIVGALTVVGGILFLTVAFYVGDAQRTFGDLIQAYLSEAFNAAAPTAPQEMRQQAIDAVVPLFPAMVVISWLLMIFANSSLAQTILHRSDRGVRPRGSLSDLDLPDWCSWLFIACAAGTLISSGGMEYTMRNLTVVMAAPFFVVGLGFVHAVARTTNFKTPMLVVFYTFLIFVLWTAVIVALLGLMDQWFGLREKMRRENQISENE